LYARTHTHTHASTHIRKHTHTQAHTHAHAHTNTRTHTHTHTHTHAHTHSHTHTHIHTRTHTRAHTHTHTHTRAHTRTHTHAQDHACLILLETRPAKYVSFRAIWGITIPRWSCSQCDVTFAPDLIALDTFPGVLYVLNQALPCKLYGLVHTDVCVLLLQHKYTHEYTHTHTHTHTHIHTHMKLTHAYITGKKEEAEQPGA